MCVSLVLLVLRCSEWRAHIAKQKQTTCLILCPAVSLSGRCLVHS